MIFAKFERYEAYKDSEVEWIGEVPAHWIVKRIKEISEINKSSLAEKTLPNYEFEYVDIGGVTYGVKGYVKERMTFNIAPSRARRIVKKGDTIISTVRTYLKAIASVDEDVSDLIVSTGFAVISPQKQVVHKYCSYLLTSDFIIDEICALSTGVSYPATNATVIGDLFSLIPLSPNKPPSPPTSTPKPRRLIAK
jgi:restriction endonuclease S subunit